MTRVAPPSTKTDVSHRVFASPRDVVFTESEWAVPREVGAEVVREVLAMIERRRFDVSFPLEVRFVAADEESFLSPSWGRATCYVAVHMYRGMRWQEYFDAVQEIALAYGGRPHWGKRHTLDAERLASRYPMWERFQAVRRAARPGRGVRERAPPPGVRVIALTAARSGGFPAYDRATADLDPPFAVVDLAAFDDNAADLVRRAGGKPIRVASKSVRCRALLERCWHARARTA